MSDIARVVFSAAADKAIAAFEAGDIDLDAAVQILEMAEELAIHLCLCDESDLDHSTLFGNALMCEWRAKLSSAEMAIAEMKS